MIKVRINFSLYKGYEYKPYDHDKWEDGKEYYFNSLREVEEFRKQAEDEIIFTEETENTFDEWTWGKIDVEIYIDPKEENTLVLHVDSYWEWRD